MARAVVRSSYSFRNLPDLLKNTIKSIGVIKNAPTFTPFKWDDQDFNLINKLNAREVFIFETNLNAMAQNETPWNEKKQITI